MKFWTKLGGFSSDTFNFLTNVDLSSVLNFTLSDSSDFLTIFSMVWPRFSFENCSQTEVFEGPGSPNLVFYEGFCDHENRAPRETHVKYDVFGVPSGPPGLSGGLLGGPGAQ